MAAADTLQLKLPDGRTVACQVRTSSRARHLRMQLSDKGLIVTQPAGLAWHELESWVNSKSAWVAGHLPRIEEAKAQQATTATRPDSIALVATGETLNIIYRPTPSPKIMMGYKDSTLTLSGAVDNHEFCIYALQQWMKGHARRRLTPLLQQAMHETGLRCQRFTVKGQSTLWGSCSTRGNINLNYKLLFLPPDWVRYTLIHELCHTVEMNHSKHFWALVGQFVPEYPQIQAAMKGAMQHLPGWVNT